MSGWKRNPSTRRFVRAGAVWFWLATVSVGCSQGGANSPSDETDTDTETDSGTVLQNIACEQAAAAKSYLGCDYWFTDNPNAFHVRSESFSFAVVVANPHQVAVEVEVERGDEVLAKSTVDPGETRAIRLLWLEQEIDDEGDDPSQLIPNGGCHLRTSMPIAAYLFNPLEHFNGFEYTYTNDSTLLLPTSTLTGSYTAVSYPTYNTNVEIISDQPFLFTEESSTGYVTVVATEDDTELEIEFSAHTEGGDNLLPFDPGDVITFELSQGEVLVLRSAKQFQVDLDDPDRCRLFAIPNGSTGMPYARCVASREYDLTGTRIEANKPVAVFGGHECAFVPFYRYACDHLEHQIFPLQTWGKSSIGISTQPQVPWEPNLWKVVSGSDNNTIVFTPEVHPSVTLDEGEFVEFEHQGALLASGNGRLILAQFMVGEDYGGEAPVPPDMGDPAFALNIPHEQWRTDYHFLTPDSYTASYVYLVAPEEVELLLDGLLVPERQLLEGTEFSWVRVEVEPGAHWAESFDLDNPQHPQPFGILVSGIAPYTSYLYSGGLDLRELTIE